MLMPSVQQTGLVNTNKTQVAAVAGFTHPLLTSNAPKQKIIHYKKSSTFFFHGVLCHICPRSKLDFPAIQAGESVWELCDKA